NTGRNDGGGIRMTQQHRDTAAPGVAQQILKEILASSFTRTLLAILVGFVVGGVLIAVADEDFLNSIGYFFQRPSDALSAGWNAISTGYSALFKGSIFNP